MNEINTLEKTQNSILIDTQVTLANKINDIERIPEHICERFQKAIFNGDINEFKELSYEYEKPLKDLRNSYEETLIHICIKNNQNEILDYILNLVKEEFKDINEYKAWIEYGSGENRLSAIHLAGYYGNIYAIEKLILNGANPKLKTKKGFNFIHMAAQGNKPEPIVYAIENNIRISLYTTDKEGNTPLHWACTSNANLAVVNLKNNEGLTPLHITIKSTKSKDDTYILKCLLFAGASRTLLDNQGYTAMDYAIKLEHERNIDMNKFIKLLEVPIKCECFMIKRPAIKTLPSRKLVILLQIFLFINCIVNTFTTIPRIFN